ncbi:MAG: hypothetical protein AAF614_20385 [Chloroflexota bacterium]
MKDKPIFLTISAILLFASGWLVGQTAVSQAFAQTLHDAGSQAAFRAALGTGFTYQGELQDSGAKANGSYDFEFSLYDDASGGNQVGNTIAQTLTVTEGLFTTNLDFGASAFSGDARYLEIRVQLNGGSSFTTLTPRQLLSATPYALYSLSTNPDNHHHVEFDSHQAAIDDLYTRIDDLEARVTALEAGSSITQADKRQ